MTTVGFFGDSFCSALESSQYQTYTSKVAHHYNAEVVNLGHGGSSIADVLLVQLDPFIKSNQFPDICVFVWTGYGRLYNKQVRNINSYTAEKSLEPGIWNASKEYFKYLYDPELDDIQYVALLQYIDVILSKIPNTTKIIHMWAFGKPADKRKPYFRKDNITYPYRWTTGVEIRPALIYVSLLGNKEDVFFNDQRQNHIESEGKNRAVFEWIKLAVENYEDGKIITGSI